MDNTRGLIPAQIPKDFGVVDDPGKNLFRAKRIMRTFADAQAEIEEYRKRQMNPETRIPEVQE